MFSKLFTQKSGFGDRQKVSVSEIRIFGQKSIFFNGTPVFSKDHRSVWTRAPHRRWTRPEIFFRFRFRPFFVIFAKKSYPPSLWGSVCQ